MYSHINISRRIFPLSPPSIYITTVLTALNYGESFNKTHGIGTEFPLLHHLLLKKINYRCSIGRENTSLFLSPSPPPLPQFAKTDAAAASHPASKRRA
jgi:hypothetical protein